MCGGSYLRLGGYLGALKCLNMTENLKLSASKVAFINCRIVLRVNLQMPVDEVIWKWWREMEGKMTRVLTNFLDWRKS